MPLPDAVVDGIRNAGLGSMSSSSAARRVLIVEDNPDNRLALRTLLELWGYAVEEAPDGAQAIQMHLERSAEIALIDIGLPGINGYDVAKRIRSAPGGRPFLVALTGYGRTDDRRKALDAGFDAHLVKPVDPDELERLLATAPSAAAESGP